LLSRLYASHAEERLLRAHESSWFTVEAEFSKGRQATKGYPVGSADEQATWWFISRLEGRRSTLG
jgi:hypothetical protein